MQFRKVVVRNFRGISQADWLLPANRFVCLVGPGDSTKTTLLDAIGLVLSARWNVQFTDADFHNCTITQPIVLQVAVGDLPERMLRDDAHGYELSGLLANGDLVHDPEDGTQPCVVVQLKVTETLEPAWTVVRPGSEDDGVPITASKREDFGLFRVDERVDAHLRWGRGSALTRMTARGAGAGAAVTAAHRAARGAVFRAPEGPLHLAATEVSGAAAVIGGPAFTNLRPGLDPTSSSSTSALLLHDDEVPLTGHGLGTRRLTSLGIQETAISDGGLVLVDEVEHGLEPHRLYHLLRHLKKRTEGGVGQVIMTTHSPIAVEALQAADISVVRCDGGTTVVRVVSSDLDEVQGALRAGPSAVLARRVEVCEGKTEMGVIRRLIQHWDAERGARGEASHAALGACQTDGQGSTKAPQRARVLRDLGYPTLLMIDNDDRASDAGITEAQAAGVELLRWEFGNALEDEIVAALSPEGLAAFLALAADIRDEESVLNSVSAQLRDRPRLSGLDPSKWTDTSRSLDVVKVAIAAAAKGKKTNGPAKEEKRAWFKQEASGELLGGLLIERWSDIKASPLGAGLVKLYQFVYGEELPPAPTTGAA